MFQERLYVKVPAILHGEARTRFFQGIAFGAVATVMIGFIWGGWVTGERVRIMRSMAETSGRMSVLVPMCVSQFTAVGGAIDRFKTTSVYFREDLVGEVVKNVGSTSMDYSLARACVRGIDLELAKAATKS